MEDGEAPKFPYTFEKTLTRTSVDKQRGFLELLMKVSKECWALGMEGKMKMVVAKGDEGGAHHDVDHLSVMMSKEEKVDGEWTVSWTSGRKMGRADRILGCGWISFVRAYKLACGDVVAFTLLSPSLVSLRIHHRASAAAAAATTQVASTSSPLPLLQQEAALPAGCSTERALCYLKLQQSHMEGKPILMDLPAQFSKELLLPILAACRSAGRNSRLRRAFTSNDLFHDHGLEEGDFCVFQLTTEVSKSTLNVYGYKKDQGKPCNIVVANL